MKLQATEILQRSVEAEILAFLRSINRTSRQARDERRLSRLHERLAREWEKEEK